MATTYKDCVKAVEQEKRRALGDDLRRPLTAYEQQIVYGLHSFATFAEFGVDVMDKRNRHIPRAKARLRLIKSSCRSLFNDYMLQLSEESRETFRRRSQSMQLSVVARRVIDKPEDGWMMCREKDMRTMAHAAWTGQCEFCNLTGQEAKQCSLRKTFDRLQCMEPGDNPDCWYRGI